MELNFEKGDGLLPAIVQDHLTGRVLMLGFMNQEALNKTLETKEVCFFSRTRKELWTKGESSGNKLNVVSINSDCDNDTILITANPLGPTCHKGTTSCFQNSYGANFLLELEKIINSRKNSPASESYTAKLFAEGVDRISKKVGEEASEVVIEATRGNKELLKEETSDLLYHLIVLLANYDLGLADIAEVLEKRHNK